MKPNCQRICDLLAQYADGTLSHAERAEVQRHLDACPPCQAIAGKECGARQLLRACAERLRAEPVPPGLRSRCQALSCSPQAAHPWFRPAVNATRRKCSPCRRSTSRVLRPMDPVDPSRATPRCARGAPSLGAETRDWVCATLIR